MVAGARGLNLGSYGRLEQDTWNFQGQTNVEIISSPYLTPPRTCIYLPTLHIPTWVPAESAARSTLRHHHPPHWHASLNSPKETKARDCVLLLRNPRSQGPCRSASSSQERLRFRERA